MCDVPSKRFGADHLERWPAPQFKHLSDLEFETSRKCHNAGRQGAVQNTDRETGLVAGRIERESGTDTGVFGVVEDVVSLGLDLDATPFTKRKELGDGGIRVDDLRQR